MKKTISIIAVVSALSVLVWAQVSPQTANTKMRLDWNLNDPSDDVSSYKVYVSATNGAVARTFSTAVPPVEFTNVMFSLPNGIYNLSATAIGMSGFESPHSSALTIFWYGNTPSAPTNLTIEFFK
jgi:hypothetical protein